MAIYLKYDTLKGDATETAHKDWIVVHSFQFGVGRSIHTPTGSASNREASHPSVSEITITKQLDVSSPSLFEESLAGKGKTVKIDFVQSGDKAQVYLQYELSNCMVSGYSVSSGGDRPNESLSLNFTKIQEKFTPHDDKNATGQPVIKTYDIAQAKLA